MQAINEQAINEQSDRFPLSRKCGRSCLVAIFVCIAAFLLSSQQGVNAQGPFLTPERTSVVGDVDNTRGLSGKEFQKRQRQYFFQNRRDAVLEFVGKHFPELQTSLIKSEKKYPSKFRSAIYRIGKEVSRLNALEVDRPEKFELAVEQWKLKTKIEIKIARHAKKENDEQLKERLRPLVEKMLNNRVAIMEIDRRYIVQRLSHIDKNLQRLQDHLPRAVEHNLSTFQDSIDKIRAKQKKKSKGSKSLSGSNPQSSQPPQRKPNQPAKSSQQAH